MPLALEIVLGMLPGPGDVLAGSRLICPRSVHLVPQKGYDRDDHDGAHEQWRRERGQILHTPSVLSCSSCPAPHRLARGLLACGQRNTQALGARPPPPPLVQLPSGPAHYTPLSRAVTVAAACACSRVCWVSPGRDRGTRLRPRRRTAAVRYRPRARLPAQRSR